MNWAEIFAVRRRQKIFLRNGSIMQTKIIPLFIKNNWREENIKAWRKEGDGEDRKT